MKINLLKALDNAKPEDLPEPKIRERIPPFGFEHRILVKTLKKAGFRAKKRPFIQAAAAVAIPLAVVLVSCVIFHENQKRSWRNHLFTDSPWSVPGIVLGLSPENSGDVSLLDEKVSYTPGSVWVDGNINVTSDPGKSVMNRKVDNLKMVYQISARKDTDETFYYPCFSSNDGSLNAKWDIRADGTPISWKMVPFGNLRVESKLFFDIPHADRWPSIIKADKQKTQSEKKFLGDPISSYQEIISNYGAQLSNSVYKLDDKLTVFKVHIDKNTNLNCTIAQGDLIKRPFDITNGCELNCLTATSQGDKTSLSLLARGSGDLYFAFYADGVHPEISINNENIQPESMCLSDLIAAVKGKDADLDFEYKIFNTQFGAITRDDEGLLQGIRLNRNDRAGMIYFTLHLKKDAVQTIEIDYPFDRKNGKRLPGRGRNAGLGGDDLCDANKRRPDERRIHNFKKAEIIVCWLVFMFTHNGNAAGSFLWPFSNPESGS